MPRDVPLDILDEITETLRGELVILKNVSLVSRSFCSLARKRLFANISLSLPKATGYNEETRCIDLLSLTLSNPRLLLNVRSVSLVQGMWPRVNMPFYPLRQILEVIVRHGALQSFAFTMPHYDSRPSPWGEVYEPLDQVVQDILRLPSLTAVTIYNCSTVCFPLDRLLNISHLSRLSLISKPFPSALVPWDMFTPLSVPRSDSARRLLVGKWEHLDVDGKCGQWLIKALRLDPHHHPRICNLLRLSVTVDSESSWAAAKELLHACMGSLETLALLYPAHLQPFSANMGSMLHVRHLILVINARTTADSISGQCAVLDKWILPPKLIRVTMIIEIGTQDAEPIFLHLNNELYHIFSSVDWKHLRFLDIASSTEKASRKLPPRPRKIRNMLSQVFSLAHLEGRYYPVKDR